MRDEGRGGLGLGQGLSSTERTACTGATSMHSTSTSCAAGTSTSPAQPALTPPGHDTTLLVVVPTRRSAHGPTRMRANPLAQRSHAKPASLVHVLSCANAGNWLPWRNMLNNCTTYYNSTAA